MTTWLLLWTLLAGNYTASPAPGNRFTLEVEKTGLMKGKKHRFSFPKYSGTLQYDPNAVSSSTVEFTLDGASMVCEDDWVKDKDQQAILDWGIRKMIEADQHPTLRFVSESVKEKDAEHFEVRGALTIRGMNRSAVVQVVKTKSGDGLLLDGSSVIDMRQWGMKPPSARLGIVGTQPEMLVKFHLVFTPSK